MDNLKVIENELVPVYETSTGEKVVYGMELHEVLEVKSNYRDWIKNRLNDCEAEENEDYESFAKNLAKGGRPAIDHLIKLDIAKEMAMLERNERGKQVRRYFIRIEKKYKENVEKKKPLSALEQIKLQNEAILEVNEKVESVQGRVEHLENTMNIDYAQQKQLKDFVNEVVVNALGGRKSRAYRYRYEEDNSKLSLQAFSRFWKDFKDYFRINAYANLPRVRFNEALQYINKWQPPTNMQLEIGRINREDLKA